MSLINKTIYFLLAIQAFLIAQPKVENFSGCSTCVKHVEIKEIIESISIAENETVFNNTLFNVLGFVLIVVFFVGLNAKKIIKSDEYHISIKHYYPV